MSIVLYTSGPTDGSGYVAPSPSNRVESKRVSSSETRDNSNMEEQPLSKLLADSSSPQSPTILSRQRLKAGAKAVNIDELAQVILREDVRVSITPFEQFERVPRFIYNFLKNKIFREDGIGRISSQEKSEKAIQAICKFLKDNPFNIQDVPDLSALASLVGSQRFKTDSIELTALNKTIQEAIAAAKSTPIPFRAQLRVWAEAKSVDKFARLVLRDKNVPSPIKDEQIAQKVCEVIQIFLRDSGQKFNRGDLENLQKLKKLLLALEENISRRGYIACCKPPDLEKAIKKSIHSAAILKVPDVIIQHIAGYLNAYSSVLMYSAGIMPKPVLAEKLNSSELVRELASELFNKFKADRLKRGSRITFSKIFMMEFSEIINIFFSHASTEMQNSFFKRIIHFSEDAQRDLFLEHVISFLPNSMQSLDLSPLTEYISDKHLKIIANRMINLQSLSLQGCIKLTDKGIALIAGSPHMANLQELDLRRCWELTDKAVEWIKGSPHMANLQKLDLRGCWELTDKAVEWIKASPHMAKLQRLAFEGSSRFTDKPWNGEVHIRPMCSI